MGNRMSIHDAAEQRNGQGASGTPLSKSAWYTHTCDEKRIGLAERLQGVDYQYRRLTDPTTYVRRLPAPPS